MSTQEVETKAKELGWAPKDQFRGDPEKWIDAEAFVKRGEELMPILRANNTKLLAEISTLRGELSNTRNMLNAASESIDALKEFNNSATIKEAKAKRAELTAALAEARKDGDVEGELEITDKLEETRQAIKDAESDKGKEKPTNGQQPQAKDDPVFQAWLAENSWFTEDKRRRSITIAIATELRNDPETANLKGKPFLDKVVAELEKTFPAKERPGGGKPRVEGGGRGGGEGSGGGSDDVGKTYSDLPSEVKSICDKQAARLVGPPPRAFKDLSAWRAHYANEYFNS